MIRLIYTVQGQIIGEVKHVPNSHMVIKNPVMVVQQQTGVQFVPLGGMSVDKEFTINPETLLFSRDYAPIQQLVDKYNEIFGSGIQIVSSMPK